MKPIVDALKGVVYEDDIQVVSAKGTVIPVSQFFVRVKIREDTQILGEIRST